MEKRLFKPSAFMTISDTEKSGNKSHLRYIPTCADIHDTELYLKRGLSSSHPSTFIDCFSATSNRLIFKTNPEKKLRKKINDVNTGLLLTE